jgi:hypothetical protein
MMIQLVDSHAVEFDSGRWAAEELALQLGWLRECPYHGEPFRNATTPCSAAALPQPGSRPELYSSAMKLSSAYSEHCPICAHERALPE